MRTGLKAAILVLTATVFAGCGTPPPKSMRPPAIGQPMTSSVTPGAPLHPTVSGVQRCLMQALRQTGAINQLVLVERVDSEATDSKYAPGLPQPYYNTYVTQVLSELGFKPILLSKGIKARGLEDLHYSELRPNIVVQGSVTGFDGLVAKWRDARDGGIGFGKGRGLSIISGNEEEMVALGQVMATVILSAPKLIPDPGGRPPLIVFPVTATGSATAEFKMAQSNSQSSASVVIGIGAGQARERVNVVDVQSAALFAVRMAVLLALAQQFNLSTPVCTA